MYICTNFWSSHFCWWQFYSFSVSGHDPESFWTFLSLIPLIRSINRLYQLFYQNGSIPFLTTSITIILFQGTIIYPINNSFYLLISVTASLGSSHSSPQILPWFPIFLQWPTEAYKISLALFSLLLPGVQTSLLFLHPSILLPQEMLWGFCTCSSLSSVSSSLT